VEIALDLASSRVGGSDDSRTRSRELCATLRISDRRRDKIGEGDQTLFGSPGSGPRFDETTRTPQGRLSTVTGAPTEERMPTRRASSATPPVASSKLSLRVARPVRETTPITFSPSTEKRVPIETSTFASGSAATTVTVPSAS
jgi:hypothetical protein